MNKKNTELAKAMIVLASISMVFTIAVGIIMFIMMGSLASMIFGGYGLEVELFGAAWVMIFVGIVVLAIALKSCTFVFAKRGRDENSAGKILTAAILFTVSGIGGDVISIAGAVCGFILYSAIKEEENLAKEQTGWEYDDNTYGNNGNFQGGNSGYENGGRYSEGYSNNMGNGYSGSVDGGYEGYSGDDDDIYKMR